MTHYLPLLPPPEYPGRLAYEQQLKLIGLRLHTALARQNHPSANAWDWADRYDQKQAIADKEALRHKFWHLFEPGKLAVHNAPASPRRLVAMTHESVTTITVDKASPVRLASRF